MSCFRIRTTNETENFQLVIFRNRNVSTGMFDLFFMLYSCPLGGPSKEGNFMGKNTPNDCSATFYPDENSILIITAPEWCTNINSHHLDGVYIKEEDKRDRD